MPKRWPGDGFLAALFDPIREHEDMGTCHNMTKQKIRRKAVQSKPVPDTNLLVWACCRELEIEPVND